MDTAERLISYDRQSVAVFKFNIPSGFTLHSKWVLEVDENCYFLNYTDK